MPSGKQVSDLSEELRQRATIPPHIKAVLAAMAPDTHPMVQFSTAVNCLQVSSGLACLQCSQLVHQLLRCSSMHHACTSRHFKACNHIKAVMAAMARNSHPMVQSSTAVNCLQVNFDVLECSCML